ncbi:MAG: glucose-6-phosphate isomerase [Betaproteobacteria bacterium]|nr:MAG: glucose-6-phosphate isomerase [Betaproteobacteria bacterium]
MSKLTRSHAWKALQAHQAEMAGVHLRELFARQPGRAREFSLEAGALLLDYSKHRVTDATLALLVDLARQAGVEAWRARMFAGEHINASEDRAVLHVALRSALDAFPARGDVMPLVRKAKEDMRAFSEAVRGGRLLGNGGKPMRTVVNIGIGGSDLGPRMLTQALWRHADAPQSVAFVANADPGDLARVLAQAQPETTLFIIASKTFTTVETLGNARLAKAWLVRALGSETAATWHFAAVTANTEAATAFGIARERCFPLWDWVGGRYSVWSSVGLPVAIAIGMDRFEQLLAGARAMDEHFLTAPLDANMPVLLALLGIWYANFFGAETHAVLPYAESLRELPAYLQQLEMESNGKSVDRDGQPVDYATVPVVWGAPGTNSQHAFHQMLHQGTHLVPCDFLAPADTGAAAENALAQAAALMAGREATLPQRRFDGNRPTSTLMFKTIDAYTMGQVLALYEHKVFVQGIIWNLNSFDQWGVELGKDIARALAAQAAGSVPGLDASTNALLARLREWRS